MRQDVPLQSLLQQTLGAAVPREKHEAMLGPNAFKLASLPEQDFFLRGTGSLVSQLSVSAIPR
jgi:hypothetical protein